MTISVSAKWDSKQLLKTLDDLPKGAARRALRKAGATALRDMKSEASKRIRARKRIKSRYISRAMALRRPKGSDIMSMSWSLDFTGEPVPLVAYPHKQTKKGVVAEINRGKKTLIQGAFKATMKSGHQGVYRRKGKERLPILQLLGSRPVDAMLFGHEADAVAERGGRSFGETFRRVLPFEVGKGR